MARRGGGQSARRPTRDGDAGADRRGTERSAGKQLMPGLHPTKPLQSLDRLDLTNMEVVQAARCHLNRAIGLLK